MTKTFLKTTAVALCALLLFGSLSACAPASLTGTWYSEENDAVFINFDKDGNMAAYDSDGDYVSFGSWTEKNGSYEVTGILMDEAIVFKMSGKDTLYCEEYDATLKKGANKEIPDITEDELTYAAWITQDGVYELEFYYDGEWDLYDYEEGEYITEGTYTLVNGKLIMKDEDGTTYEQTIADNRLELTLEEVVFFRAD